MKTQFLNAVLAATNGRTLASKKLLEIRKQVASEIIQNLATLRAKRIEAEKKAADAAKLAAMTSLPADLPAGAKMSTIKDVFGSRFPSEPIMVRAKNPATEQYIPEIDQDYCFQPPILGGLLTWTRTKAILKDSLWLFGPMGAGKSSVVQQFCARLNVPLFCFEGHERVEAMDFFGGWINTPTGMKWQDGPVTAAARIGGLVLINEGDAIPPSALIALNGVSEGHPILIKETGEVVKLSEGFGLIFACNTGGSGSDGFFTGTFRMSPAFCDRFQIVKCNHLPSNEEETILAKKVPHLPQDVAEKMIAMANEVRDSFSKGILELTMSTRTLIRWGTLASFHQSLKKAGGEPLAYALCTAFAMRGETETTNALLEMGQRIFGGDLNVWLNHGRPVSV